MSKRIGWIDIARGIGILLVVLGHSVTTVVRNDSDIAMALYDLAYFIQVPLLMFVSGLAFELNYEKYLKQTYQSYFISKCKRLLIPYVSYSFLVYLIFTAAHFVPRISEILENMSYGRQSIIRWAINLVIGNNIYCEHLWYLYSLFLLSLFSFILIRVSGRNYRYILLILTILMWRFLRNPSDYDVIWKTSTIGKWFALGCLIGVKRSFSKEKKAVILISGVISFAFMKLYLDMIPFSLLRLFLKDLIMLVFLLDYIVVSQLLEEFGDRIVHWIGENSMCIYIFHQPFWGSGLGVVLYSIFHLPVFVSIIAAYSACIVIPLLINRILQNSRLRAVRFLLLGY